MRRSSAVPALISERRLRARVGVLGRRIRRDYQGRDLVLVGVLKGSFIFMADLVRRIGLPLTCDFLRVSSYGSSTRSNGSVRVEFDLTQPIRGKHVLLVEDIIDTGLTARAVISLLKAHKPASVRLCALLHKPERSRVRVSVDYLGFRIPNRFVVGYGLDHAGRFRNLPYIGVWNGGEGTGP
jgi:hypoxanthine phosphoribosyltransferase